MIYFQAWCNFNHLWQKGGGGVKRDVWDYLFLKHSQVRSIFILFSIKKKWNLIRQEVGVLQIACNWMTILLNILSLCFSGDSSGCGGGGLECAPQWNKMAVVVSARLLHYGNTFGLHLWLQEGNKGRQERPVQGRETGNDCTMTLKSLQKHDKGTTA